MWFFSGVVNGFWTKVSCRYVLFWNMYLSYFESCRWKHYNPTDINGYPPSSSVFESLSDVIASCSSSIVKPVAFVAFAGHVATATSTSDTLQNSSRLVIDKVIEFLADWQFKSARFKSGGRDSFMKSEEGWPLLLILARSRSKGRLSWNEDMGSVTVKAKTNCVWIMSFRQGEFSVEFWMFVLNFFQLTLKSDLKEVQFTQNYFFWVKEPL